MIPGAGRRIMLAMRFILLGLLALLPACDDTDTPAPGTLGSFGPDAPAVLGREEETRRITDLLDQLPDGYREPLLLKAVQGLSYRQIGHILGLPDTTVETRIARGRKMLRELAAGEAVPGPARAADANP